jgi:prepilin-type N-terminal cleavage/methylation domain-containing protein
MDTKLTAPLSRPDAGVTLIELMVVVAIMSVLAVGVSITAVRTDRTSSGTDRTWFERSYDRNRTLAIHGQQSRGLNVRPNGLVPVHMTPDGWAPQTSAHRWADRVALNTRQVFDAPPQQPDIMFLSNGQTTAFDISFSTGLAQALHCRSNGWTGLICDDS